MSLQHDEKTGVSTFNVSLGDLPTEDDYDGLHHAPFSKADEKAEQLAFPKLVIPTTAEAQFRAPLRDTGFAAYKVLFAATVVDSIIPGFALSFGVFHDYYLKETSFTNQAQSSWIGVLSSGLPFLGAPFLTYLCQTYTWNRQYYVWLGWSICVLSLALTALCESIPSLIITQGLLFGIGNLIFDIPILIIVNTWFIKRRGYAYGILFGAADLLGVGWAFLANALLYKFGLRYTFLIIAALVFTISGPAILLLKERPTEQGRRPSVTTPEDYPLSAIRGNFDQIHTHRPYYQRSIFYILAISNLLQAFAFYLPLIYLPSFTTSMGFSSSQGATVLAVANLAQIAGEMGFGKLSDKLNVNMLVVVSSTVAALATFLLWGLAASFAPLIVFALLFGCFGSGFMALWARMGTLFGEKDAQMVFSVMSAGRGIGAIFSGPISVMLLKMPVRQHGFGKGGYFGLILFVGICMASSALLGAAGLFAVWYKRRPTDEEMKKVES